MQSTAQNVLDYIAEAPQDRQNTLQSIRDFCLEILTDFTEKMMYGMACYVKNDTENTVTMLSFANQKNYITIYFPNEEIVQKNQTTLKNLGKGVSMGKNCVKFSKPNDIDFSFLKNILSEL